MATISSLEAQLNEGTKVYQKLQQGTALPLIPPSSRSSISLTLKQRNADFTNAVESRQRLDAQKAENEAVKKEFATLLPTNQVYKLVGPVLLKQEQGEAKSNVDNRLELIGSEIKRVEEKIADVEKKLESKKMELVHIQTQLQTKAQEAEEEGGAGGKNVAKQIGASAAV
ncbi:prefoldin beta subunit, partial [Phenoliferia sp. Uapishka_3]